MDSIPLLPQPHQPLKPSASKLPIKRKTRHLHHPSPPTTNTTTSLDSPPIKFHRIWTEPDEINFLQGLLNSSSLNLSFPGDLPIFYDKFSASMSQPYTKSQLSEKLRRLRKKFRVTSSRISRGLDVSLLSAHDRALYELSNSLWAPDHAPTSPFGGNVASRNDSGRKKIDGSDGNCNVELDVAVAVADELVMTDDCFANGSDDGVDVKISEVSVGYDFGEEMGGGGRSIGGVAAKSVLNVFDECLKDVRTALVKQSGGLYSVGNVIDTQLLKNRDFQARWRKLRVAEFDLFARRLRLVLDNCLRGQSVCN